MSLRLFKTKRFAMLASKAWVGDEELREAFTEMLDGKADNLGGGVWKKRLNANRHRSIVLAKGGRYWVYQFLYAKNDQSNISLRQLADLRELAKSYAGLTEMEIQRLLDMKEFVEIPHGQKIQKRNIGIDPRVG
ncbi:MAG: type II toxin-antitoxin system RelE/ParE family toxin [Pseudomonas mandelii]